MTRHPVFPLGFILFPGTGAPLHLFEPRYRQLLADIRHGDRRFVLLPSIRGTPPRDLPTGRVGCIAEVTDIEMLPDGRSNIMTRGVGRVALAGFVDDRAPYHVAEFTPVEDVADASAVALALAADDVAADFHKVVRAARRLGRAPETLPALPDDPAQLAWTIAAIVDLADDVRYRLLAETSAAARLATVSAVLRTALPELELRAAMRRPEA